jgi:formamidopyrimidine-DNA glycosylase
MAERTWLKHIMAEMPEVETLFRDLREAVVGRTLLRTEVLLPAAVRYPAVDEFTTLLSDRLVRDSQRRAKYILLSLSGDLVLAIHLALWGTVALVPDDQPRLPETLIIWHLDREEDLRFTDKLGYVRAADESLWLAGIDPRRSAATLTTDEFARLHSAIQQVLTEGIALRGTQRDLFGRKGGAIHRRNIFERTGEPCPRCGIPIVYIRIDG